MQPALLTHCRQRTRKGTSAAPLIEIDLRGDADAAKHSSPGPSMRAIQAATVVQGLQVALIPTQHLQGLQLLPEHA